MAAFDQDNPRIRFWPPKIYGASKMKKNDFDEAAFILSPYYVNQRGLIKRSLGAIIFTLFCVIYGFIFSVTAPNYFAALLSPIFVLSLLVIWALPDMAKPPVVLLRRLFFATLIALIAWPDYLAISLPGLPWITLMRLTSFPLTLTLLICLSISHNFRADLTRSLRAVPSIPILFGIFNVIDLVTIGFSKDIGSSIQRFLVAQTTWTAVFFVAAYVFRQPGMIRRWAICLWSLAIFVTVISIWEYRLGRLPWLGHIPSFLAVPDESVQRILAGSVRAGTDRYRTQATFSTPLGLAEYIAITLPFVLHFCTDRFSPKIRWAAWASVPLLLLGVYLTDAKLGSVGCLIDIALYAFIASFKSWKRDKGNLVAASMFFGYPAAIGVLTAALMFSGRFKNLILGTDGSHDASTDARVSQYTLGFHKILEWPFGYGPGMSGDALGFGRDISGMITVDTYYLTVLLENGVPGFICLFGMMIIAIYEAGRRSVFSGDLSEERSFFLPIMVSLVSFVVIKSVFSQPDNHPVIFMMLGALMALCDLRRKVTTSEKKNTSTRVRITAGAWQP